MYVLPYAVLTRIVARSQRFRSFCIESLYDDYCKYVFPPSLQRYTLQNPRLC